MSLACHPGWARTNLVAQEGSLVGRTTQAAMNGVSGLFRISYSLYDGALPAIEALIADDAQPYKVYLPDSKKEMTGPPIPRDIDHTHCEDEDIDKQWVKPQELVGVTVGDYV